MSVDLTTLYQFVTVDDVRILRDIGAWMPLFRLLALTRLSLIYQNNSTAHK